MSPGSRSSSSQSHSDDALEIPGFFYDREKKKYFKILPSQNVNAGAVTKETIREKKEEEIRKERIKEFLNKKSFPISSEINNSYSSKPNTILKLLEQRSQGMTNIDCYKQDCLLRKAANLKACGSLKMFTDSNSGFVKVEHVRQMIPDAEYGRLLCLWTLKESISQRIQTMEINTLRKTDDDGTLETRLSTVGLVKYQHLTQVSHLTWAEQSNGENPELRALFTANCFLGCNPSAAHLIKLNPTTAQHGNSNNAEMFTLGPQAAWTCAWSRSKNQFSIGTENCSMLLDVSTRKLWELNSKGQSVHTQAFDPVTNRFLYSGTRKGCIFCHDLRSISTHSIFSFNHRTSISYLLPLKDTNYILASDFSGKICQWDLRKRGVVKSFQGQNKYSFLPFHLDQSETVLYSAGQDCYTRLWNFATGELLTTIPPPFPASREVIPALCMSAGIGQSPKTPALLLGMKDTLHLYA